MRVVLEASYALERKLDVDGFREAIEGSDVHQGRLQCEFAAKGNNRKIHARSFVLGIRRVMNREWS